MGTRGSLRATVVAAVVAIACWAAPAAAADPGDIGYQDQSFAGFGVSVPPSGTKPESKLWFNDGIWWADMFDTVSKKFKIFRLDTATQTWTPTSTVLDDRSNTMADVLWDGSKLYVASHVFQEDGSTSGFPSRLYRFSYNPSTDAYSLDTGFPVQINDVKTETLVIDKDSTGQLWATWTAGTPKTVWVNRTACLATCDDAVWGTPFQLSTNTLLPDDISSLVAFGPPGDRRIGVMWSDQDVDDTMWFAVHADGDDDLTWSAPEAAVAGANAADDHINLKSDASGRVYAATKTSLTGSSPLTYLLVRPAGGAPWVQHVFGLGTDHHTRPIVVLDETNSLVHMFATQSESGGTIYEKTLPMGVADANGVNFTPGLGTPRIRDASALRMNNSTSTKQPVSAATGLVVLAANKKTDVTPAITDYWHEYDPLTGGDTTPPVLGSAGVDGSELTLAYSEPLDETSVPSGAAFTVKVNTVARAVNLVSVYGPTVVLTLASPVIFGDTVTVGYAIPGASPLQDLAGNAAAAFTNASATNTTLAGSIATLHPTGDGTRDAVISANGGGTTNLFAGIDDGIATPDDDLTYVQNQSNSSGAYFAQLTDMPANFGSMSSVKLDLRARTVNRVDDTTTLYAQLFAADETTPLSDEVAVAVDPGLFNWATIGNVELTGVVPGTKAGWDGAKLRLRWAWTQVDTLDVSNRLRVTVVELRAGYVNAPDSTPPVLQDAHVNGSSLTLAYDEPLDTGSVPAAAAFSAAVNGGARGVSGVSVAGSVVTLTLTTPAAPGDTVTVSYTVPATAPVQDQAGNDAAGFAGRAVTNDTVAGSATLLLRPNGDGTRGATVKTSSGATTSLFAAIDEGVATPDDSSTYIQADRATSGSYFALLQDTPADFAGMASLDVDVRARTNNRTDDNLALYAQVFKADETTPLTGEALVATNPGPGGWTTIANVSLPSVVPATRPDWDGARLRLRWAYTQVGAVDTSIQLRLTAAEVHGSYTQGADTTPPLLQSAHVTGSSLTLAYDEPLDAGSVPAAGAFAPTVNGAARGVAAVGIAGSTVTLSLATPVAQGDAVTVSYTVPGASPIQDVAGNDAAGLADAAVTNDTVGGENAVTLLPNGDGTRGATVKTSSGATTSLFAAIDEGVATPDDSSTYIQADKATSGSYFALLTDMPAQFAGMSSLTVDFRARTNNRTDDNLALLAQVFAADETTPLTNEVQLAVNPGTGGWVTVSGVALTGLVPASKAVWDGARLRLRWAYTQVGTVDTSIQLRLTAVELDGTFATGGDTTPPSLQSAHVNAASLTLAYDETLDGSSVPAAASFTATVGGVNRSVSAVAVGGSAVTLTLSSPVAVGETVTVSYAVPGAGPLQDLAGNDAPAFTGVAVTNDTSGGGGTVTLNPLADAYVKSSTPGTNYGGATSLQLRDGSSDGSATARTYLKFDLSGISGTITSVKLRVFVTDAGTASGGVSATSNDFSGGGAWTESALTWSNAPAPGSVLASLPTNALGSVEITLPASAFASGGPVFSLVLAAANTNSVLVTSKEAANPPQLVVATS